jgi:hypothetical protein
LNTNLIAPIRRASPRQWAGLALAAAVVALGVISVASAENAGTTHGVHAGKPKTCANPNGDAGCVAAINTSTGNAVFGYNTDDGYGVLGLALGPQSAGTAGVNYAAGPGVAGTSNTGYGVTGYSGSSVGIFAENSIGTQPALLADNLTTGPVMLGWSAYGLVFFLDGFGNMSIDGEIYTKGGCAAGCSRTRHVESFAARTSQPTLDDVGESTIHDGSAHVALDPAFANAIDGRKQYVVLLTPEGDASLYVDGRTPHGFDVRQVGGGRANVAFAYRIVAKPYAVKDERLPMRNDATQPAPTRLANAH